MWRVLLETAPLFLTPFLAYVAVLLLRRRWPFVAEFWRGRIVTMLTVTGLCLVIAGMVATAFLEREQGAYVPAHVESGRLVPGAFR